jgi:hypothetical protein
MVLFTGSVPELCRITFIFPYMITARIIKNNAIRMTLSAVIGFTTPIMGARVYIDCGNKKEIEERSLLWFAVQYSPEIIHRLDIGDCGLVDNKISIFTLENGSLNHRHLLERFKLLLSNYHLGSLLDDYSLIITPSPDTG